MENKLILDDDDHDAIFDKRQIKNNSLSAVFVYYNLK